MATLHLLYQHSYPVNDDFSIVIPTVGEVIEKEDEHYSLVSTFVATPWDFIVQLNELGIDSNKINDFELFIMLFNEIKDKDLSLIIKGIDLSKFTLGEEAKTGKVVLWDKEDDKVINKKTFLKMAAILRKIYHIERPPQKIGNKEALDYKVLREKAKAQNRKKRSHDSEMEQLITALVCCPEFNYDYESIKNLTIYQFNESVRQVIKRVDYDKRMIGIYAGTVDVKKLKNKEKDLNWLTHEND